MKIKFENRHEHETITYCIVIVSNDTFIEEKQEKNFKKLLINNNYKIIVE